MLEHQIGSLPLTDAQRRLVGIIIKSDIFKAFLGVLREQDELKILQRNRSKYRIDSIM